MPGSSRQPARPTALALLLGGILLGIWLGWAPTAQPGPLEALDGETRAMAVGDERFVVELATTPASRQRGLMGRPQLAADRGMLFLYDEPAPRTFWMKNVRFGLDILYLDADWRILHLVTAPPCVMPPCPEYPSSQPARYVLELPAGSGERLGLAPGQRLEPPDRI